MSNIIKREPAVPSPTRLRKEPRKMAGEVEEYFSALYRRKWIVLAAMVSVFGIAAYRTFTATPLYRSSVNLLIEAQENVLPYAQLYQVAPDRLQYAMTQTHVLQSRGLADRVVQRLGLAKEPEDAEQWSNWLRANLQVVPFPATPILKLTFSSTDAKEAADVVNAIADEYILYSFESRYETTSKAREFLQVELERLKAKVSQSEAALLAYGQSRNPALFMSPTDNVVLDKLSELNRNLTGIEERLLSNRYEDIKSVGPETLPESQKNAVIKDLESRLTGLNRELTILLGQFGPGWPDVKRVRGEVAKVQEQLTQEVSRAIDQEKVEYELLVKHRARLLEAINQQSQLADRLNQDSIQYNILKREVESDQQIYQGLLQRLKQTMVMEGEKPGNIRIIDHGTIPKEPYSPSVALNLVLGFGVGLLIGVGLAAAFEFFDKSLKTPAEIERNLGLPSLGVVPFLGKDWSDAERRLTQGGRTMLPRYRGTFDEQVRLVPDVCWESYRALRASLLLTGSLDKAPKTILVTSALPKEGKTVTCLHLGTSFAQAGGISAIIELDMRRPCLAKRLGLRQDLGMSTYLSGEHQLAEVVLETSLPKLSVAPGGPAPSNSPELIGSQRMRLAFNLFPMLFSHIIIDTPPVLSVADALLLAPLADGVILVAKHGETPRDALQEACDRLTAVGARLIGVVTNGMDARHRNYTRYYSYYGSTSEIQVG